MKPYLFVNTNGALVEVVEFGNENVEYLIIGVVEHEVFGIYFSFNKRFEF